MVHNCCVVNCNNRCSKGTPFSFHSFPGKDPERLKQWVSRISRRTADGKPWQPTKFDKVCSAHFLPSDFCPGLDIKTLKSSAVPSVFPQYPVHKQVQSERKRPSPKKRKLPAPSATISSSDPPEKVFVQDHSYCCPSIEGLMYPKVVKVELDQSDEDHSPGADFNSVKDECRLQPLQLQLVHLVQPDPQHSSLRDCLNDNSGIHLRSPIASPSATQQPTAGLLSTKILGKRKQGPNIEDEVLSLVKDHLFKLKPIPATREVEDQHDVFGKNIAHRLRSLPRGQRIHVEKLFSDVLYEAELGHLNRSSVLVTAPDLDD